MEGYTPIVQSILNHSNIDVRLNTAFDKNQAKGLIILFGLVSLISGFVILRAIRLSKTLDFEKFEAEGDFQVQLL